MTKWLNISSIDFDRTVRRVCAHDKRMRFNACEIGLYCFRCHNIMPLEPCSKCGGTDFDTDTYTGNIGFYCKKCRKGFDHFACTCGEVSWIDSIHLRRKAPPTIIEKTAGAVIKIILLPVTILKYAFKYLIALPVTSIVKILKYPFVQIVQKMEQYRIRTDIDRDHKAEAFKWTEIYFQRNPGWIGSGFPLRALGELKCAAEKGNGFALKALEKIFYAESDEGKKVEAAEYLKAVTGKDYMPPDELRIKLSVHRMRPGPLPEQPDGLP